jgi:hypothetical protein
VPPGGVPAHAEGDRLHLDEHAHPPGLPRVEQKVRPDGTDIVDHTRTASRGGAAPPASQWSAAADAASRAFRCSFVRPRTTAGAYSRWARRPARAASRYIRGLGRRLRRLRRPEAKELM